jgi:3-hydroxybutyryl-CoA dehydrogenase
MIMHVAIVGAGTMGADIAQAVALGNNSVTLLDTDDKILRLALSRISQGIDKGVRLHKVDPAQARRAKRAFDLATELEKCAAADLVIEAVDDNLGIKQSLFLALDDLVRPDTILASSTNTLSITQLAAGTRRPERVVGLHFCNPAHIMRLVEVVRGQFTRRDIIEQVTAWVRTIGKTPIIVPDIPGLLVNRMVQTYIGEALRLLDDSNLDAQTVDQLMEAAGFPMGPFRLMNFLGAETVFEVTRALFEATFYEPRYRPHPRQQRMLDVGLGRNKDSKGFYR